MACYSIAGNRPRVHPSAFVHPLASLIGRVEVGPGCYIGAGACLRADWLSIRVGPGSSIQDSCTVHGRPGCVVELGEGAHLGHGCVVHGATLERFVLVGMNAVVQDDARLGEGCVIGAGCVVPSGMVVPPAKLVLGVPAKIMGDVRQQVQEANHMGIRLYQGLAQRCLLDFGKVDDDACLSDDFNGTEWKWQDGPAGPLPEEFFR